MTRISLRRACLSIVFLLFSPIETLACGGHCVCNDIARQSVQCTTATCENNIYVFVSGTTFTSCSIYHDTTIQCCGINENTKGSPTSCGGGTIKVRDPDGRLLTEPELIPGIGARPKAR